MTFIFFYIQDTLQNFSDLVSLNIGSKRTFSKAFNYYVWWNCELIVIFKITNSSLTNTVNFTCGSENTGDTQLLHGFAEQNVSYWVKNNKIYLQLTW